MPPQAITIFFASCIYPSLTHTPTKKTLIINAAKSVTGTKHPKSIFAQRFTTQHDFSSLLFFSLRVNMSTSLWDLSLKKSGFVCKSVIRNGKHPHIGYFIYIMARLFYQIRYLFDFLVISCRHMEEKVKKNIQLLVESVFVTFGPGSNRKRSLFFCVLGNHLGRA